MSKLSPYFPTLSRKIIATKRLGNDVALLVQAGSTFILSYGQIVTDIYGSDLKILAQKVLTAEEAQVALATIFADATAKSEPILLEVASNCEALFTVSTNVAPVASPFFATLETFLSFQKTRGPNKKI